MKIFRLVLSVTVCLCILFWFKPLRAQNTQSAIGEGNNDAIAIAQKSPLVQSSYKFLLQQTQQIRSSSLRKATYDAIENSSTCIRHRANLTDSQKQSILQQLQEEGLVDTADDSSFPGGLINGVFPPINQDGSSCPQLPQPFLSAPGGSNNSHHAYPGGLPVHEAFNNLSGLSLSSNYRAIYGQTNRDGLPIVDPYAKLNSDIYINDDLLIAAPIWHDWAKSIVFQWNADGTEFKELNFGGNGKTDNYGASGNSKTGSHHIIGLAEAMKRGLSPEFVITQASAHSAPTLGNEYKVVNWLRAAAILAQIDPVAKGYLFRDSQNHLRLAAVRKLGSIDLTADSSSQTNLLAEYALHNLSDADYVLSIPAFTIDEVVLQAIASQYGYDYTDQKTYIKNFRNPVLSYLSAERLLIVYSNKGIDGVKTEINKLSKRKII